MLDGPFNDINEWDYAALPAVLRGGVGHRVFTEDELDRAFAAARAEIGTFTIIDVHIERHDVTPTLANLTARIRARVS
jgi:indolepyruvate decarboxylase